MEANKPHRHPYMLAVCVCVLLSTITDRHRPPTLLGGGLTIVDHYHYIIPLREIQNDREYARLGREGQ